MWTSSNHFSKLNSVYHAGFIGGCRGISEDGIQSNFQSLEFRFPFEDKGEFHHQDLHHRMSIVACGEVYTYLPFQGHFIY